MIGLFVALGIAILTLLAILLWFVPHLLQQQAQQVANESAQLREMISEMISEQEAVAMRQVQLGTSVSYLQDQLRQLETTGLAPGTGAGNNGTQALAKFDPAMIQSLESRMDVLQVQLDQYEMVARTYSRQDNESWMYLISLLHAIQERIQALSEERPRASMSVQPETSCKQQWGEVTR